MKIAIDNNGIETEVSDDTEVKSIDGIYYLLTDVDRTEIAAREAQYIAQTSARSLAACYAKRLEAYGTIGSQLDMIYHSIESAGNLNEWLAHITAVKENNPKPE